MSVLISGVLTDGAGLPMSGYHIILKARQNTSAVVMRTVATVVTGPAGEYAFEAQTGKYDVYLRSCIEREYCVGDISVYHDSKPGTLNDFLTALDEGDLKPDVVKRFEEMVAQAQQGAETATESERQAGQHADAAAREKEEVKNLAKGVQQNADAVAEGKQQAENLVSQVENAAEEVKKNAEAAKQAASDAEHVREDIDTALSATLKTANRLSELADEGEEAQQESRDNLGLKSAATMTPQSDIRDRTEGRLATPGAFGFGHIFLPAERIRFNTEDDFLSWARNATPGEYFVDGGSKIISGGVLFNGVVSIRWVEASNNPPEPRYTAKVIIFYGINGDVYYSRYWTTGNGYLTGWENLKITSQDIISLLSGIAPGTTDGWYGAGSLVLAAYNGKGDADTDRRIKRGYSYPGSRLSAVEFMCYGTTGSGVGYNGSVSVYVRGSGGGMPGSYRALSGDELGSAGSASVMIGLFIRIA
ncbi:TPA: prophage tail fiber N-terminal domain-containing protein [Escherichia coli]|nr:prophage tail fiber N-terminal domain-containing protein [Escherichia coli]HEK5776083.1 prophage tail fiber N-terminal domain-containing protein [Escherichia coli]HEK5780748.1 prophage tail fiber N-terminal domain-containing protein [Escherichia coli]HEK5885252.1 prophage tail fiber N-terminal domain-containing protein [Escherichia coli]